MTVTKDDVLTRMLYSLSDARQPRELREADHPQQSAAGDNWNPGWTTKTYAEWSAGDVAQRSPKRFFRYVR